MNHLRGTYINSMFLNEMTINEVAKEITYNNTEKGFGIDRLSPKVLQCIANYILSESLTHIFNITVLVLARSLMN